MTADLHDTSTETLPTVEEFTGMEIATLNDDQPNIAVLNLFAAKGLPGTEDLDVSYLLDTLDEWAERVKFEIRRHIYRYDLEAFKPPTEYTYGNSLGRFFC